MELRCMMCGRIEELNEDHPKYEYYIDRPPASYVCIICTAKITNEAKDQHKPEKPM